MPPRKRTIVSSPDASASSADETDSAPARSRRKTSIEPQRRPSSPTKRQSSRSASASANATAPTRGSQRLREEANKPPPLRITKASLRPRDPPKNTPPPKRARPVATTKRAAPSMSKPIAPPKSKKSSSRKTRVAKEDAPEEESDDDHVEAVAPSFTLEADEDYTSSVKGSWVYSDLLAKEEDSDESERVALEHIIRAHSRSTHEGQDDVETDTWAVEFQPTLPVIRSHGPHSTPNRLIKAKKSKSHNNAKEADEKHNEGSRPKSSSLVATCGGNTVCLVDCRLGKVVVKYSHVEEEQFMSLAWTTLDHFDDDVIKEEDDNSDDDQEATKDGPKKAPAKKNTKGGKGAAATASAQEDSSSMTFEGGHSQANILAAGGRLGSIKLINPTQNTCYKYLHGHTDAVLRLRFSLTNPRWLYSASSDGTVRLWDIGSLTGYETEARCLAKFGGLGEDSVTAIGVCEKYLIAGTEKGVMARYNLFKLEKILEASTTSVVNVQPDRIFPNSQEWHESSVDDILYIPFFSEQSYAAQKASGANLKTKKSKPEVRKMVKKATKKTVKATKKAAPAASRGRGRSRKQQTPESESEDDEEDETESDEDEEDDEDDDDGEFIFASRENSQGEIIVWDASKSTAKDAAIKTILEWCISESWSKFALAENMLSHSLTLAKGRAKKSSSWESWATKRQNALVAGSTDGKVVLYDLGMEPTRARDGNIVAQKPSKVIVHPGSTELFRDVAVSQDLSTIVAGDWSNRVFVWNRSLA